MIHTCAEHIPRCLGRSNLLTKTKERFLKIYLTAILPAVIYFLAFLEKNLTTNLKYSGLLQLLKRTQ